MFNILFIRKYSLTLIGLVISIVLLLFSIINNFDFFEKIVNYLHMVEVYEVDEFIIPSFIFLLFAFLDLRRRQKEYKIKHEKLIIYKAMLSSSHHVLNNFLNQMQLFKITAEDTPGFDPEILELYNTIIKKASEQIYNLGNITSIDEESISRSVDPEDHEDI